MLVRAATAAPPFAPPPTPPQADEILLISTREMGTTCDPTKMERELVCRRLTIDSEGHPTWDDYDWHNLQSPSSSHLKTVIYVHGNRVELGNDAAEGMAVYDSLVRARSKQEPLRYIIWSWPSGQIPGLIKDYKVKAERTNEVAWQLAWFVDQMPAEMQISLMGYSYGTHCQRYYASTRRGPTRPIAIHPAEASESASSTNSRSLRPHLMPIGFSPVKSTSEPSPKRTAWSW